MYLYRIMRISYVKQFSIIIFVFTFFRCSEINYEVEETKKFSAKDPFQKTIVPSQTFNINPSKENVLEGTNGTILIIPKECILDAQGAIYTKNVQVELAEALSLEQMLLSNLTTTSNGKLLETGGMIYLDFKANGEKLSIDKSKPIYIEIPTKKRKSGMMAYKGVRDEMGNMNWIEPKPLEQFLVPVDLKLLDFLPSGFEAEVNASMLYRNYKVATKELVDSLYYSLSVLNPFSLIEPVEINYDNIREYGIYAKYQDSDYQDDVEEVDSTKIDCGIDPAIIKTIKSEKFQNTLISTKEFENRLQTIFKTCRNDIIEIYIQNLDKNLWELDSMAASALIENDLYDASIEQELYDDFIMYYKQGLTNVKDFELYANLLKTHYEKRLSQVRAELENKKAIAMEALQAENEKTQKIIEDYQKLLQKREKYRMEAYGFTWNETGWINVDKGIEPKDWDYQKLEIIVENGKKYERIHTYVVFTSIKSLYKLNTFDSELFFVGNGQQDKIPMTKDVSAIAISIAYQGEVPFFALQEFMPGKEESLNLSLKESSNTEIKSIIKQYDNYATENRIENELAYMKFFADERKRQEKIQAEKEFMKRLYFKAYPCCEYRVEVFY